MAHSMIKDVEADAIEAETQRLGRELAGALQRRTPSLFERRFWDEQILAWTIQDESIRAPMFRLLDVLPALRTHEQINDHLRQYLGDDATGRLASVIGLDVDSPNTVLSRAQAVSIRSTTLQIARRFVVDTNSDELVNIISQWRRQGLAFSLRWMSGDVLCDEEADRNQEAHRHLIENLAEIVNDWPINAQLDGAHGDVPRINAEVRLSALTSGFRPVDPAGTRRLVQERLRPLIQLARDRRGLVQVAADWHARHDLTLKIIKELLIEDEFRDWPDVGIALPAYLTSTETTLNDLLEWSQTRGTPVTVCLQEGDEWDQELITARYYNRSAPVFVQPYEAAENFERQTRFLMEHARWLRPAIRTEHPRRIAHALACAGEWNVPPDGWELQMRFGLDDDQAQVLAEMGYRVRIVAPCGALLPSLSRLIRTVLRNPSNESILQQCFGEGRSIEEQLMKPNSVDKTASISNEPPRSEFAHEPRTDFSQSENRDAMQQALDEVRSQFGEEYPPVTNGQRIETRSTIISRDPSRTEIVVGLAGSATTDDAVDAISAAQRVFRRWSQTEPHHRAEYLEILADNLRNRRFELAAWIVFESGKTQAAADTEVAEAIDFCMYYAMRMRALADSTECGAPGEHNSRQYRPRGVAVVISPSVSPLSSLTGMTVAALVTGNTVVMKPASQASVVAAKLMEILESIGLPDGVVNFLPGTGDEIGTELINSPDVDIVAFAGSRTVGLSIYRDAADTDPRQNSVKQVIAQMGGNNAIIIDEDADLDDAIAGVLRSAFDHSGQSCSACSRVIVLKAIYKKFLKRLAGATKSLKVGPADDPATSIGPLIDEDALERVRNAIDEGREPTTVALETELDEFGEQGLFIAPVIFADVDPHSPLAQEEIAGPVLSVIPARNLNDALRIANDAPHSLAGGIYSRSPAHLKLARQEFLVGNLYLNRPITAAMVDRQPFGGFGLSGLGAQAGGPDYLLQFLVAVNISETTTPRLEPAE